MMRKKSSALPQAATQGMTTIATALSVLHAAHDAMMVTQTRGRAGPTASALLSVWQAG